MNKMMRKKFSLSKKLKAALTSVALIIIAALCAAAIFSAHSSAQKPALFETDEKYVEGIDVSSHNGDIDWEKVAGSVDFAVIRAGYRGYGTGEIVEDQKLKQNLEGAESAGIPVGVYFYSQAVNVSEAREEADFVLDLIKGYDVDLPVFIDFEYAHGSGGELTGRLYEENLSSSEAADIINAFCEKIVRAGKYAGVYSSSSMFNLHISTSKLKDNLYIWVADYNGTVTYLGAYDIWQYTKSGSCSGVNSKSVDLNYWFV